MAVAVAGLPHITVALLLVTAQGAAVGIVTVVVVVVVEVVVDMTPHPATGTDVIVATAADASTIIGGGKGMLLGHNPRTTIYVGGGGVRDWPVTVKI